MAKVGPKEQGGYDPFHAISDTLSDLASDPEADTAVAPEQPEARRSEKPDHARSAPAPKPPVSVEAPAPAAEPNADQTVHEGGRGGRSLPSAPAKPKTVSSASALQTTKRFLTTRREASDLDAAAIKLGAALGVSVDFSKVTRALWDVYLRHQEDILRNVPDDEIWERPANNDAAGLAELDQRLADLINKGLMVACRRPQNNR